MFENVVSNENSIFRFFYFLFRNPHKAKIYQKVRSTISAKLLRHTFNKL